MSISFKWNRSISAIAKEAVGGDGALLYMANEAKRLMNPFVPMDSGNLADNTRQFVQSGHGYVHYLAPYASANYYGAGRKFNKEKHPLATAYWDKAMRQVHGAALVRSVQQYIERGGIPLAP